jgi:hypothetical protein
MEHKRLRSSSGLIWLVPLPANKPTFQSEFLDSWSCFVLISQASDIGLLSLGTTAW